MRKGLFISLEGGEGVGKSTQVALLVQRLLEEGYLVKSFREPGGTKIGEQIRSVTHNPSNTDISNTAEALLFAASRAQTVDEVYLPHLEKGFIVIADRYVDSSYVYQGIARGLGYEKIKSLNDFATSELMPDRTFLLSLDHKAGHKRRKATDKIDRMDLQEEEFYQKVDDGYREIAKKFPERIVTLDAGNPIDIVQEKIWRLTNKLISGVPSNRLDREKSKIEHS